MKFVSTTTMGLDQLTKR